MKGLKMDPKQIVIILIFLSSTACNYRLFDLAEFPELQGGLADVNVGNKITEQNFQSIFQTVIKPKCLSCHKPGGDAELVPLDTYADLTSSEFGPALVVPGQPTQSPFYQVMLPTAGRKLMPPKRSGIEAVDNERLEVIATWISNGAVENP